MYSAIFTQSTCTFNLDENFIEVWHFKAAEMSTFYAGLGIFCHFYQVKDNFKQKFKTIIFVYENGSVLYLCVIFESFIGIISMLDILLDAERSRIVKCKLSIFKLLSISFAKLCTRHFQRIRK